MSAEPSPRPLRFPLHRIPAKAALRRPLELPEYLPARMLNEFVYCPRLFFYEWVDGVFRHSSDTIDGAQKHEKPVFGYRLSYRRVLEVQVRLLARYISGEIPSYPGFETR